MLSKKIGIDLGTSLVTVYVKGEGIVLREPPLIAHDPRGGRVVAVGTAASELVHGQAAAQVLRAVQKGSVVDYRGAGAMLQHVIGRVIGRQRIFRPDVMLSIASTVTGVERRAVLEATMQAGAKTAYLIEKPLAAAIGAGIAIATTEGIAVCDLGAGSAEATVIAQGEMIVCTAIAVGGERLDDAIVEAVRTRHGVRIERQDAERLKIELGHAVTAPDRELTHARGRNEAGQLCDIAVTADDVHAAIAPLLEEIIRRLRGMIEELPSTVLTPTRRNGMVLTGGGAQLRGLDRLLGDRLGLPVRVAGNPQACVATGTGLALDNLQMIRRGQHYIT